MFSFTPVKEIAKLPLLISHFIQHYKEDASFTIAEFFRMHYLGDVVFDEDYAQDMQLPFKVVDFVSLPVFVLQETQRIPPFDMKQKIPCMRKIQSVDLFYLQNPDGKGIFHPPQFS